MGNSIGSLTEEDSREVIREVQRLCKKKHDEMVQRHEQVTCIVCEKKSDCALFVEREGILVCPGCAKGDTPA
jgi:hypothetical protein